MSMLFLNIAVEENEDIDGLLIILNTVGGDGRIRIAEMIASMKTYRFWYWEAVIV